MVLAKDWGCSHGQASLARHCLRQLRDGGRFRPAREAARPGSLGPRGAARRALPAVQWVRATAHHGVIALSVDALMGRSL